MAKGKKDKAEKRGKHGTDRRKRRVEAVPDELREAGRRLVAAAGSPAGRQVIAAGLSIAAAAVSAGVKASADKKTAGPDAAGASSPKPSADTDAVFAAIGTAAETFFGNLFKPKKD